MEVEYAFLADAAQTSSDGKLFALGAGIDVIRARKFPAKHPILALVLKFHVHPTECDRQHEATIELWDADGNRLGPQVTGAFTPRRRADAPARETFAQLVINIMALTFPHAGMYAFQIGVDGRHLKALPLEVVEIPEASLDVEARGP